MKGIKKKRYGFDYKVRHHNTFLISAKLFIFEVQNV